MPLIRKERAGSDSFGNHWPEDGAAVTVDPEHAAALLAIPDGGFSEVPPPVDEAPADPEEGTDSSQGSSPDEDPDEKKEVSEVDPAAPAAEPEAKAPPAKKTPARKTAATKVEE